LSAHQDLTPEGFLLARDIRIARCGTQFYRDVELPDVVAGRDGWICVDRDPSEVFNEDSIASFTGKPITNDHPTTVVTPDNWHNLAIGTVQNVRKGTGSDHDCLVADLLFTTQRGIDLIRTGKRALSVGYDAFYEQTSPGRARQRQIVANHVALVDEGRCGPRCTIVDGAPWYDDDYTEPPLSGPPVREYLGIAPPNADTLVRFVVDRRVADTADIDWEWTADIGWEEGQHKRGQPKNKGQFAKGGGGGGGTNAAGAGTNAERPDKTAAGGFSGQTMAGRIPASALTPQAKAVYTVAKSTAELIANAHKNKLPVALKYIMNREIDEAMDAMLARRDESTQALNPKDAELFSILSSEKSRRTILETQAAKKRADEYAWMSDDELYAAIGLNFGGDSGARVRPRAALGKLPTTHIKALVSNGTRVQIVKELPPMAANHPYAPNMQPAGSYNPYSKTIAVADQITMPDGTQRLLNDRMSTLRHEIGHAMDDITGLSRDLEFQKWVGYGVERMSTAQKAAAQYWLGAEAKTDAEREKARRSETFAELYSYAYNTDFDPNATWFGGLDGPSMKAIFGTATKIMRGNLLDYLGEPEPAFVKADAEWAKQHSRTEVVV
jgi:hypothetical protein